MVIQFGKYKGQTVEQIAANDYRYAQWAAKEIDNAVIRNAFAAEISKINDQANAVVAAKVQATITAQGGRISAETISADLAGRNATKRVMAKMQTEAPEMVPHFKKILGLYQSERLTRANFKTQAGYEKAVAYCEAYAEAVIAEEDADDMMSFYSNYPEQTTRKIYKNWR